MKQFLMLAALMLVVGGCYQQPQPIIIERQAPPVYVQPRIGCSFYNHCGRFSCPACRANGWYRCNANDHCGGCPHCRANGWVGFGIHIGHGRIGIGVNP